MDDANALLTKRAYLIAKVKPLNDPYEADSWRMPYKVDLNTKKYMNNDEAEVY